MTLPTWEQVVQFLAVAFPSLILFLQYVVPAIASWRKSRAESSKIDTESRTEQQKISALQNEGWEKLYLRQQEEIIQLRADVARLDALLESRTMGVIALTAQLRREAPNAQPDYVLQ